MMASRSHPIDQNNPELRKTILLLVVVFIALHLIWVLSSGRSDSEIYLAGNLSLVFSGCASTVLAFAVRHQLIGSREALPSRIQVWTWLGTGLAIWTLNDLGRMLLEKLTPQSLSTYVPIDLIYLIGAVAILIGLLKIPRKQRENIGSVRLMLDMGITSVAIFTMAWLSVFQPGYQFIDAGMSSSSSMIYPVVDLILILVLVNLFLISQIGSLTENYGWIGIAIIIFTLSDLTYSYMAIHGDYQPGGLVGFGWTFGDGIMILAAISQLNGVDQRHRSERMARFSIRARASLQSLLPLVIPVVIGLYTIMDWQLSGQLNQLGLWVTTLLCLLVIARQGFMAGEVEFQQHANLVNSVAEPTFVCDRRGLLRLANPAFLTAAGCEVMNQMINQPLDRLISLPGSTQAILDQALKQGWSGESQLQRSDGSKIPVTLALRPISSGSDHSLALAGTAHDLTEYKRQQATIQQAYEQVARAREALELLNSQLEEKVAEKTASLSEAYEQLEQQNRELQTLDQMKSDFVSLVSHELRAPLTNINGGIELVLSHPYPFPPRVRSTLDLVQAEIQRLTRFVETILDLSALEAGRTPLYPAPLHLETIITRLKNQMRHLPDAARVRWQIPEDLPFIMADEQALTSIIFHLLDNAMKYAPDGEIVVSSGVQTTRAWVQVADEGPGVAKEALPFLFSRFYRSRASDSQTVYGHGLGLYIVRRLIEAMQGEIQVMNRPQGGACFTCWLPTITISDQDPLEADFLSGPAIGLPPIDLDQ